MNVNQVIEIICKEHKRMSPDYADVLGVEDNKEYYLETLEFVSKSNPHLKNYTNEGIPHYLKQKELQLNGEEEVFGDFLICQSSSHDEEEWVFEYDSLEEVEKSILSESGVLNPFTSSMVVIAHQQAKPYEVINNQVKWL